MEGLPPVGIDRVIDDLRGGPFSISTSSSSEYRDEVDVLPLR
jgi:hypothetical protein